MEKELDFRIEIRIDLFWRELLGDAEYAKFDPVDLLRWYLALDLIGPIDVRAMLIEREGSRPMPALHGIVSKPPHPPVRIIRQWLETHETKVRTRPYWYGAAVFASMSFMLGAWMNGCQFLKPMNPLVMNSPPSGPNLQSAPKAAVAGPLALASPTPKAPATSATGPVNSGLSGGGASASPTTSSAATTPH